MKNITDFISEHGRPPFLDKGEKPYEYRGWLLFYVQELHASPLCPFPDRYSYLYMVVNGTRDPGPIPKIEFSAPCHEAMGNFDKCVKLIESKTGSWSSIRLFLEWLGYGLGVTSTPSELDDDLQSDLYRTADLELWLKTPYDYIGQYICEGRGKGWNPNSFYPTPHAVITAMEQMTFHDLRDVDARFLTVNDPCLGTGRMLMHAGNYSLMLSGADIDGLVLLGARINGAVYVPWINFPVQRPAWADDATKDAEIYIDRESEALKSLMERAIEVTE